MKIITEVPSSLSSKQKEELPEEFRKIVRKNQVEKKNQVQNN